jgi:hypothetical protein
VNFPIPDSSQSKDALSAKPKQRLKDQMTHLLRPLVRWAVCRGLGHGVVARWLKPVFLQEAQRALRQQGLEATDSALALAAGLHRGDIQQLRTRQNSGSSNDSVIPITHQILANWVLEGLPAMVPFKSTASNDNQSHGMVSFSDLVQRTSKAASQGFSARLLLQDMVRQGLVSELPNDQIQIQAFGHSQAGQSQSLQHLSQAVHDLLSAGLYNIKSSGPDRFLEQSLEVDGLHTASVTQLHDLATQQWHGILQTLLPTAKKLSDADEPQGGNQRMRLGIYVYAEPMDPDRHASHLQRQEPGPDV